MEWTGGFWFGEPPGDCDATRTVAGPDYDKFFGCHLGPDAGPLATGCDCLDLDDDGDVDLVDLAEFARRFNN